MTYGICSLCRIINIFMYIVDYNIFFLFKIVFYVHEAGDSYIYSSCYVHHVCL